VAKKRSGHYLPGRRGWIKTKNRDYWRCPLKSAWLGTTLAGQSGGMTDSSNGARSSVGGDAGAQLPARCSFCGRPFRVTASREVRAPLGRIALTYRAQTLTCEEGHHTYRFENTGGYRRR
jgi:hypothetical protein